SDTYHNLGSGIRFNRTSCREKELQRQRPSRNHGCACDESAQFVRAGCNRVASQVRTTNGLLGERQSRFDSCPARTVEEKACETADGGEGALSCNHGQIRSAIAVKANAEASAQRERRAAF